LGIDQKLTSNLFAGIEGIKRDLSVPYLSAPTFPATQYQLGNVDWKEYLSRAYIYWAPLNWISLTAEYQFEQFKRDEEFMYYIKRLDTHRVPLGVNLFHPSGLSFHLKTTYVDQKGDFETSTTLPGETVSGSDSFWLVDVSLSYRLPKRYGILTAGVRNLFDESFKYFDTDARNPIYQPDRVAYFSATIELP
jgi:outer membrane receptor protein involved in Fe transport